MDVDRIPRLVLNWKPEGKNRRGRLRKKWKDKLMKDMTENGIEEEDAMGKLRCKQILKKVFWLKGNLSVEDTPVEEDLYSTCSELNFSNLFFWLFLLLSLSYK